MASTTKFLMVKSIRFFSSGRDEHEMGGYHRSNVGVSLLAIAVCQTTEMSETYRYREQAHSCRVR
ncbi:hypothetical protein EMIT0215P_50013 [Pseudomonas serboccidentalis]